MLAAAPPSERGAAQRDVQHEVAVGRVDGLNIAQGVGIVRLKTALRVFLLRLLRRRTGENYQDKD